MIDVRGSGLGHLGGRVARRLRKFESRLRFRFGLEEQDPRGVDVSSRFRHPIEVARRSSLTTDYRARFPDALAREQSAAAAAMAHHFDLLGHHMHFEQDIAWSRDPVSGRDWPDDFSPDIPYRGDRRLGDIKLPWELNKHQYFFTLGKVAWLEDDDTGAREIVRQIVHWIDANPWRRGIHWTGALESGARAISWIFAWPFYADACEPRVRQRIASSLARHMLYVEANLSTGPFTNTHLIGEAAALVLGGLFLECREAPGWLERGLALLEEEIHRQSTADGAYAELSIAYHRFFLDHYYLVDAMLQANGRAFSPATLAQVERMTSYLMNMLWPDGTAPAFGDGDDARGLWVRADAPLDYRALLGLGAVRFDRGDFKWSCGALCEEILWLYGDSGIARFEALEARAPSNLSVAYAETGYVVMRGGWGANDPVLMFDCGPLGPGPSPHGHADALSIQLFCGAPWLVDAGTYSYNLDYAWRDAFRSTRAHNTLLVDGEEQSVPADRMSWRSMAGGRLLRFVSTPVLDLAEGEHDGYARLAQPALHRRTVIFLRPDTWWIVDRLAGAGLHQCESTLHLQPDCSVGLDDDGRRAVLRSEHAGTLYVQVGTTNSGAVARLDVIEGNEAHRTAWHSPSYGVRVPTRVLIARAALDGTTELVTCVTRCPGTSAIVGDGDPGELTLERPDGSRETVYQRTAAIAGSREARLRDGIVFDGLLLYRRSGAAARESVSASAFRALSIPGRLRITSPTPIDACSIEGDTCRLEVAAEDAGQVHIAATPDLRFEINDQEVRADRLS